MSAMRALALGLGLGLAGAGHAAGDVEAGKVKAQPCLGCHGVTGYFNVYPTYHVPKVAGQNATYIVAALKAYAGGQRQHPTMHAQAASLSEEDMQDIAAYFAASGGER